MIALAAKEIVMGRHSNLGPIDPQIGGRPAIAILEEFEKARKDIAANAAQALLWQPILQQYTPTLLSSAEQAIKWTREIGAKALSEGLFQGDPEADRKSQELVEFLISHDLHHAHGRHLHRSELSQRGLKILELEGDDELQDAVLSVHHSCMLTVGNTPAAKLIENHLGIAHVKVVGQLLRMQMPAMPMMPAQPMPVPVIPQVPQPMPAQPSQPPAPAPPQQPEPPAPSPSAAAAPMRHARPATKKRAVKKIAAKRVAVKKSKTVTKRRIAKTRKAPTRRILRPKLPGMGA